MQIIDFYWDDQTMIQRAAEMLVQAFKDHWPNAWPDMDSALDEVHEMLKPDRINRIALNENGYMVGWIGAIPEYRGNAWELHPLVVRPDWQGMGVGSCLVADLEAQLRARGVSTIYLGSDDEDNMTSLGGVDLYENLTEHIANIRNLKRHPYEFYQKQGYKIVGVIPDANGPGKPDIIMAKRLQG